MRVPRPGVWQGLRFAHRQKVPKLWTNVQSGWKFGNFLSTHKSYTQSVFETFENSNLRPSDCIQWTFITLDLISVIPKYMSWERDYREQKSYERKKKKKTNRDRSLFETCEQLMTHIEYSSTVNIHTHTHTWAQLKSHSLPTHHTFSHDMEIHTHGPERVDCQSPERESPKNCIGEHKLGWCDINWTKIRHKIK